MRPSTWVLAACLGLPAACSTADPPPNAEAAVEAAVVREIDGIDAVRERFNADVARPRFITILSAT